MNALFQTLFATTPFKNGLYKFQPPTELLEGQPQKAQVITELQKLFGFMERGKRKWLRPDIFPKLLEFPTFEQQDVQG